MKRVVLCVLLLALVLTCSLAFAGCVKDKSRVDYVFDEMELFDQAQLAQINDACVAATRQYNVPIYVATCARTSGGQATLIGEGARSRYHLDGDAIIIILNATAKNNNYHFDLYTFGNAALRVKDAEIDAILYANAGDDILASSSPVAANALVDMVGQCGRAYSGRIAGFSYVAYGIVAFGIALAISLVVAFHIKKQYSRKRKNEIYPLEKYCTLNLKDHNDTFVNSVTTFVIIESNSSSGGGSHSSGGGGGGGHRGGR